MVRWEVSRTETRAKVHAALVYLRACSSAAVFGVLPTVFGVLPTRRRSNFRLSQNAGNFRQDERL
jgi:hypothetical protein